MRNQKGKRKHIAVGIIFFFAVFILWIHHNYVLLIDAIGTNRNERVEALLKRPYFDINRPSGHLPWIWLPDMEDTVSPLEQACRCGNYKAAKMLIARGADADQVNNEHCSLLYLTMEYTEPDDYEMVKLLIKNGADPNGAPDEKNDGMDSLSACAGMDCGDYYYNWYLVPYQRLRFDRTRIASAHYDKQKAKMIVKIYRFLEKKVNHKNEFSDEQSLFTPLHRAVMYQNLELIQYILDKGKYDINDRDESGQTCLFSLVSVEYPDLYDQTWKRETLDLLMRYGADVNIKDTDGKTVYDYAVEAHDDYLAGLLKPYMKNSDKDSEITD